ncbi:monovalent cation/H+ antiporter complex subunit F [Phycisphaerales bacterium AB-hyl4]|uniref:Monovalent cation/H+ antiporter complex subunit F n=1 Tax=Natronomicrosphaera hydrolytica TaxID=3242702 RepID=A0ABV4U999_9BACT
MIRQAWQLVFMLLAVLAPAGAALADLPDSVSVADDTVRPLGGVVNVAVELGIAVLVVGMVLCLYRIMRGPHLVDRVLATDALALHVVGLVIALAIYLRTTDFLDVALVVAIIGFAGTLAFSQYIAARGNGKGDNPSPAAPERSEP